VGRVTVTLKDAAGRVTARAGDATYDGDLVKPPRAIAIAQKLSLSLARTDVVPPEDPLELTGKVVDIAHTGPGVKNTPLHAGLRFTLDVGEIARGAPLKDTLDRRSGVFRRPDPVIASLGELPVFDDLDRTGESDTIMAPPPVVSTEGLRVSDAAKEPFPYSQSEELLREPTGVIGTLRHVSLPEVIQGLEIGRRTAQIDIRAGDEGKRGTVFLKFGQVIACFYGADVGDFAFYALANCRVGTYRVRFDREAPRSNISLPTAFLLLEAMRRIDEENSRKGVAAPELPQLTGEFRAVPANITLPPPPVSGGPTSAGAGEARKELTREQKTRNQSDRARRRSKEAAKDRTARQTSRSTFSSFFQEAEVEESGEDEPGVALGSVEESFLSLKVTLKQLGDSQRQFVGDTDWSRVLSSSEPSGPSSPSNH